MGDSYVYCGNMNWLLYILYVVIALGLTGLIVYLNNTVSKSNGSGIVIICIVGMVVVLFLVLNHPQSHPVALNQEVP